MALLEPSEQQRAQRFRSEQHRHRFVVCRGRLRELLAGYCDGSEAAAIRFELNDYGKPRLAQTSQDQGLVFNVSHSGGLGLILVGYQCVLGVDVEQWRELHSLDGMVERCFADREQQQWRALDETEQLAAFYCYWSCKESFVKAVGQGLSLGLEQCIIATEPVPHFVGLPEGCGALNEWSLFEINLGHGISAAAAVRQPQCRLVECHWGSSGLSHDYSY